MFLGLLILCSLCLFWFLKLSGCGFGVFEWFWYCLLVLGGYLVVFVSGWGWYNIDFGVLFGWVLGLWWFLELVLWFGRILCWVGFWGEWFQD